MRFSRFLIALILSLVLAEYCPVAGGQKVNQALTWQQMTRQSGYIFSGTVTAIQHVSPQTPTEVATMQVTFRVEQAIVGVHAGQTLVIREWAGLWDSSQRYRTGEHVLLFLYPFSKLGLTSPVGGPLGRFEVDPAGTIVLDRGRTNPFSSGLPPRTSTDSPKHGKNRTSTIDFARAIQGVAQE